MSPYDTPTFSKLSWLYGHDTACSIAAGNDPKTNTDLAAWRGLGGLARPLSRDGLYEDRVMTLAAQGLEPEAIRHKLNIPRLQVFRIMAAHA